MGAEHGKNAQVFYGGLEVSPFLNAADFGVDGDTAEASTFRQDWKRHLAGMAGATLDTTGFYDPTMQNLRSGLLAAPGVLTVAPAGADAVGAFARLIAALSASYKESSKVGDVVGFTWGVKGDDAVGFGRVLHPLAAESGDGTGTTHIGPIGGTTGGAVAHLHVTSVSASDSIVVTLEDSANGSDWAPIAGGAFASKAAAGAERLVIPGTIRRYTRAAWDVTGAGVSIAFIVALARL